VFIGVEVMTATKTVALHITLSTSQKFSLLCISLNIAASKKCFK